MKRKKHPDKEIEEAIQYAEEKGWRYKRAGNSAHAWGRLLCSFQGRDGCSLSVWSTPKNPGSYAKQIRKKVNACFHNDERVDDEKK